MTPEVAFELRASTPSCIHVGLTLNSLPGTLGIQLRAGPQLRSQAGPWVMVHREEGASEHGVEAESAACGWIPAKAETPAFSMGFKRDPGSHNTQY